MLETLGQVEIGCSAQYWPRRRTAFKTKPKFCRYLPSYSPGGSTRR